MIFDKLIAFTKQLYPTGRAWRLNIGSVFENLHNGLSVSEEQFYNDAKSILNSAIPDNDEFSVDDATDWERRLGLITNSSLSLDERKQAIIRKMNFPGVVPARQSYLWLQNQLQLAGFNVWVHENLGGEAPEDVAIYPDDLLNDFDHGMFDHGEVDHGGGYINLVANKIDNDFGFELGSDYKCTFFIGGETKGLFADVDASRELEFRQIILMTKPVQTVAVLFINYV
jgi:uncharacterized protein YmfQ (DUF2313 family)